MQYNICPGVKKNPSIFSAFVYEAGGSNTSYTGERIRIDHSNPVLFSSSFSALLFCPLLLPLLSSKLESKGPGRGNPKTFRRSAAMFGKAIMQSPWERRRQASVPKLRRMV